MFVHVRLAISVRLLIFIPYYFRKINYVVQLSRVIDHIVTFFRNNKLICHCFCNSLTPIIGVVSGAIN